MKKASNYCYVRNQANRKQKQEIKQKIQELKKEKDVNQQQPLYEDQIEIAQNLSDEEIDTNVIVVSFDFLKNDKKNLAMGDPIFCKKCNAVINRHSKIWNPQEYKMQFKDQPKEPQQQQQQQPNDQLKPVQKEEQKMEIEEQKIQNPQDQSQQKNIVEEKEMPVEVNENDKVWVCEFCSHHNVIQVEQEEIPKDEDIIYMLKSAQQIQGEKVNKNDKQKDVSIIFCIDNSGSMNTTQEIEGKVNLKHGITEEEYNMLKQFIEPGDENQEYPYLGGKKNKTHVSRKQCVLAAIEDQLSQMSKEHPDRIIGVVTFNNEVIVVGDGSQQDHVIITGDKLNKFEQIQENASKSYTKFMSKPINQSIQNLVKEFDKMQAKGQTALGPGLLASLTLAAQGKPGSMVILCTDGLANIGLGQLQNENDKETTEFYTKLEEIALQNGVSISIITIKGEGCKLDVLGQMSQKTNGNITRVDPQDISKDFALILKDEIVGTKVNLEMRLHKSMKFRNELQEFLKEGNSLFAKQLGNVTVNTTISFEYQLKSDEELVQLHLQDEVDKIKEFPFQTQIKYTTLEGHEFLRVLTSTQKVTNDRNQAEQEAQVNLIHNRIAQQSAQYVQRGDFAKAKKYNKKWEGYVESNSNINSDMNNQEYNLEFKGKQKVFKKAVNSKVSRQLQIPKDKQQKSDMPVQQEKQGFFSKLFGPKLPKQQQQVMQSQSQQQAMQAPMQKQMQQPAQLVQMQFEADDMQDKMQSQQQAKLSSIPESKQEQLLTQSLKKKIMFSASEGSESDEDNDEAIIVQYQQQKKK